MLSLTCISKIKDNNGKIIAYRLSNYEGREYLINTKELKQKMITNEIQVTNLKLTSNNRIISKTNNKDIYVLTSKLIYDLNIYGDNKKLSFKTYNSEVVKNTVLKAKLLGYTIKEIDKQVFKLENETTIQLISTRRFVIESGHEMFKETSFKSVDLRGVDTSNCKTMVRMFKWANIEEVNLSGLDTSNVTKMDEMFEEAGRINITGLNTLDTQKLESMRYTFAYIQTDEIDLSSWNVKELTNIDSMLLGTKVPKLKLFNNTRNLTSMSSAFCGLKTNKLDISNLNTNKVANMDYTFANLKVHELNLGNFSIDICKVSNANSLFNYIKTDKISIKNLDKLINALEKLNFTEKSIEFLKQYK